MPCIIQRHVRHISTGPVRIQGLAKAIRECVVKNVIWEGVEKDDPEVRVALLPDPYVWFNLGRDPRLLIRRQYDIVWKELKESYVQSKLNLRSPNYIRFLLLGNSGIGKTASTNYYLMRALQEKYPVLMETRTDRVYFAPDADDAVIESIENFGTELHSYRKDPSVLLLHDHPVGKEPPCIDDGAFTFAATSPEKQNSKEFGKLKCCKRWIPLPTTNEMLAIKNVLDPAMSLESFEKRLNIFGRHLRPFFEQDQETARGMMVAKIKSFDVEKFVSSTMITEGMLPESKTGLSWWVVHVDASKNFKLPGKVDWASPYAREKVLELAAEKDLEKLRRVCAQTLNDPAADQAPTGYYEAWSIHTVASGKPFQLYAMKGGTQSKTTEIRIPRNHVVRCSTLPSLELMVQNLNRVYYFGGVNPSYDAAVLLDDGRAVELILFNATIGQRHEDVKEYDKKKGYLTSRPDIILAAKRKNIKTRFVFLVPERHYFKLTKAQMKKVEPASIEVAEIKP